QHEGALAHGHAWLAGEPAIDVGHHGGLAFFPHEDGPDRRLMVVEGVEDRDRLASGHAEHVLDPGFLEDADDRVRCGDGRGKELAHFRADRSSLLVHRGHRPFPAAAETATAASSARYSR